MNPVLTGYIPVYSKLGPGRYEIHETITYYSPRYNRSVTIVKFTIRDGASGAMDIRSLSWWVHDELCDKGKWNDGTPVTNWQASCVLSDILYNEGRWFRARTWLFATFFLGCKNARKQGMFRRKKKYDATQVSGIGPNKVSEEDFKINGMPPSDDFKFKLRCKDSSLHDIPEVQEWLDKCERIIADKIETNNPEGK